MSIRSLVVATLVVLSMLVAVPAGAHHCPPETYCDHGGGPPDEGGGGGSNPAQACPEKVEDTGQVEVWRGCWDIDTENLTACTDMEIGIVREWFQRDPSQPDYFFVVRTDTHCVTTRDVNIDPWEVFAAVGLSAGGIGTELPGTEEIPIWTGYENGFWFEGDTEAYDNDSATEPRTGYTITVEVRGWPSEVTIDTGDDGPVSGNDETASYTLNADDYGSDAYGSEDDPLFTHVYETKGTDAGHTCACFLASTEATWSGEYRWTMGGVTTGWETFPQQIEVEAVEQPLQVWEVIGQLK